MIVVKTFRIVPVASSLGVMDDQNNLLSVGADLRNEREALAFLSDLASEEGLSMNAVRNEHGQIDHIDATVDPKAARFTIESLRQVEAIKSRIAEALRRRASLHAAEAGRHQVTSDDIRAILAEALAEASQEVAGGNADI